MKVFFYIITKNLNWENLTKNLVTFKRWDGVRMKNFDIMGGSLKNQYTGGNCLKRMAWTVCKFKGALSEKEGVLFLKGVDALMHTMSPF